MRTPLKIPAETVYLLLTGLYALTYSLVLTVSLLYQTQEARLSPFELVVAGAAMQVSTFLFEIPTGIVADVRGRRFSVLLGLSWMGLAYLVMGATTAFVGIIAAQVLAGLGVTFVSGAQEAWIADEVGPLNAGKVYLRGARSIQVARIIGIPIGVALGLIGLQIALLAGGGMFLLTAVFLLIVMPETGFTPAPRGDGRVLQTLARTFSEGLRLVRGSPILLTLFAMVGFYEVGGEVFIRLNVAHFLDDVGLPGVWNLDPVVWFGLIRLVAAFAGLLVVGYAQARVETTSARDLGRWMLRINVLQMLSMLLFALTGEFAIAVLAYVMATSLSRIFQPLYVAMINLHAETSVRATVISMSRQADALGQAAGAPILGALGSLFSIRLALAGASLTLAPAAALNLTAMAQHQGGQPAGGPPTD